MDMSNWAMTYQRIVNDSDYLLLFKSEIDQFQKTYKQIISCLSLITKCSLSSLNVACDNMSKKIEQYWVYAAYKERSSRSASPVVPFIPGEPLDLKKAFSNDEYKLLFTGMDDEYIISKDVISNWEGSLIYELANEKMMNDTENHVFLDCSDKYSSWLIAYLNDDYIDYSTLTKDQMNDILDMLDYLQLPIPEEMVLPCQLLEPQKKLYIDKMPYILYINDKEDEVIHNYIVDNNLLYSFIMSIDDGIHSYDRLLNKYIIHVQFEYLEYIHEFIKNGIISIPKDQVDSFEYSKFIQEINPFGNFFRESVMSLVYHPIKNSQIIEEEQSNILGKWVGMHKQWVLLYRGSRDGFQVNCFHKNCDNRGETITIVRQKGNEEHINIFGGYTSVSWESIPITDQQDVYKYSKKDEHAFIFTLQNEFDVPACMFTPIESDEAINCFSISGPQFGFDLCIGEHCDTIATSQCNASIYSIINTTQKSSLFVNTAPSNETNYFIVDEIEVFGRVL
ncbi:hypothetical protein WA158_004508 [Blastocystis sp. Blastoise]